MRPAWSRLALRSLVRADQRGLVSIVVASLRVARSGKLLILFRFVPFLIVYAGQECEVPAFAGTTAGFAETTYANNVAVNGAMA